MRGIQNRLNYTAEWMAGLKAKKHGNSSLAERFKDKPVLYLPILARIGGNAICGLFLSQMMYWLNKGKNKEWIYKTIDEFKKETGLSRSEQERAVRRWKELDVLVVENRGVPQTRHFHINTENLDELCRLDFQRRSVSKPTKS